MRLTFEEAKKLWIKIKPQKATLFKKKPKYWNKKTEWFDSKKEKRRYDELLILEKAWKIKDLELQPRFLLLDKFSHNSETIRKLTYVADFRYKKEGKIYVEDVKGYKTKVYKMKKKLFLQKYSNKFNFLET